MLRAFYITHIKTEADCSRGLTAGEISLQVVEAESQTKVGLRFGAGRLHLLTRAQAQELADTIDPKQYHSIYDHEYIRWAADEVESPFDNFMMEGQDERF